MEYSFGQYHWIDWMAMIATFFSLYFLGNKKWYGFIFEIIGALLWIVFSIMVNTIAGVVANMIFLVLATRGLYKWKRGTTL